jgi:hypothetical protein
MQVRLSVIVLASLFLVVAGCGDDKPKGNGTGTGGQNGDAGGNGGSGGGGQGGSDAGQDVPASDGGGHDASADGGGTGGHDAGGDGAGGAAPATCMDHVKNQDETDIDCGGVHCAACPAGKGCVAGSDCSFAVCRTGAGIDAAPGTGICGECAQSSDCGADTECVTHTCAAGVCGTVVKTDHFVLATQITGDCHTRQCIGGVATNVVDTTDIQNDNNVCTTDTCGVTGTVQHTNVNQGTNCGTNQVCNANGQCVGCNVDADCPGTANNNECQKAVCNNGTCSTQTLIAAGHPVTQGQTTGDCHTKQCDANGQIQNVVDTSDKPMDDGNPCTAESCAADGTQLHSNSPPNAACTGPNNGALCDGSGHCVQCLNALMCGTDTECKQFTCTAGACGSTNLPTTTVLGGQSNGDCRHRECDGMGNVVRNFDPNDPQSDNNECTTDMCNATTQATDHTPVNAGTHCGASGSLFCNAGGICVGCLHDSDCTGTTSDCQHPFCTANQMCSTSFAQQGTLTSGQSTGDCQDIVCDGNGATVPRQNLQDTPSNTNQCKQAVCNPGPNLLNVGTGTPCTQAGGAVCNGGGACVVCNVDTDCPAGANECQLHQTCGADNLCHPHSVANGTLANNQTPNNCSKNICDGNGNIVPAFDINDPPADANQCDQGICNQTTMQPDHQARPTTTTCNFGGGIVCDGAGNCVACNVDNDCPAAGNACENHQACINHACATQFKNVGTVVANPNAGDCETDQCDGAGNILPNQVDDSDEPTSSTQCRTDFCMSGLVAHSNVDHGTTCTDNSGTTCDGGGNCVLSFRAVRVGDGMAALNTTAAVAVFVDEYTFTGSLVGTVALPTALPQSGTNRILTMTGSGSGANAEGGMSLSVDGRYVVLAGYDAAPGTAAVAATSNSLTATKPVNRIAGLIDASASGHVNTATRFAGAFDGNNVRGATTFDGSAVWAAGAGSGTKGVWYLSAGSAITGSTGGTQLDSSIAMRWLGIFNGQLYGDSDKGPNVFTIGSGMPTASPATPTTLPPNYPNATTGQSPFGFVFFDLDPSVPGVDTLYVADDTTGGIKKWRLTSMTGPWTLQTTSFTMVASGTQPTGFRGLAGSLSGSTVTLIAGTADTPGSLRLVKFVDDGTASPVGTVIVTAATNTAFRGLALSPHL